jgi:hypothetical protein
VRRHDFYGFKGCVRMHLFDSVVQRCFCLDVAYAVSARGLGPLKGVHGAKPPTGRETESEKARLLWL